MTIGNGTSNRPTRLRKIEFAKLDADSLVKAVQDTKQDTVSEEQKVREAILAILDQLGQNITSEDGFTFQGDQLVIPARFADDIPGLVEYIEGVDKGLNARTDIRRVFPFRPYDGARAFQAVMKRVTGTGGVGRVTRTSFGPVNPQYIDVESGVGEKIQVPWGRVEFTPLEAEFNIGVTHDHERGALFVLIATVPRRNRGRMETIFDLIEEELRTNSMYRGKAITAAETPSFVPIDWLDPATVVYSADTLAQLEANVWSVIRSWSARKTTRWRR